MPSPTRSRSLLARGPKLSLLQRFAFTTLVAFVIIGGATGFVLGRAVTHSALKAAEATAVENLRQRLAGKIEAREMSAPLVGHSFHRFDAAVRSGVLSNRTVVVKVWNRQGMIIYSSEAGLAGRRFPVDEDLRQVFAGGIFADVSSLHDAENVVERHFGRLIEVYVPLRLSGRIVGAFEVYETYGPVAAQVASLQRTAYTVLGGGMLILYLLLFGIVRAGSNTIRKQQRELKLYTQQLESSYRETIASLASAVDARDSQTEAHSQRVTRLAVELGRAARLGAAELRALENGAQLHDVGKIGVPDAILRKQGALTDDEWEAMRRHPLTGHDMLEHVSFLRDALPVVRHHHERWDGTGYPDGLRGGEIPVTARIFALVDAYDALTSDRPYRLAVSKEEALRRIEVDAGSHFDPGLTEAFVRLMREGDVSLNPRQGGGSVARVAA